MGDKQNKEDEEHFRRICLGHGRPWCKNPSIILIRPLQHMVACMWYYKIENDNYLIITEECALRESTSPIILFFPLFYFWFRKRRFLFLSSPFFEYMSTRYSSCLFNLPIWIMSTKCSIPHREFLYHGFF